MDRAISMIYAKCPFFMKSTPGWRGRATGVLTICIPKLGPFSGVWNPFSGVAHPLTLENPADALGPGTNLQTHP